MDKFSAQEKLKAINELQTTDITAVCQRYKISRTTLWRWQKQFDGTLDSLEPKFSRKDIKMPNAHTQEEVEQIKAILRKNPYISHKELYNKLVSDYQYSRSSSVLYNYLKRHNLIQKTRPKNDYATMFDVEAVKKINNKFLFDNKEKLPLYIIELSNTGIYIASNVSNYPCKLSVYYSVSLCFNKFEEAQKFIKSIKNSSNYNLTIKELN